jgi:hypothetical protein
VTTLATFVTIHLVVDGRKTVVPVVAPRLLA